MSKITNAHFVRRAISFLMIVFLTIPAAIAEGNVVDLQLEAEEQMQKELGAFEITAHQREIAKANEAS